MHTHNSHNPRDYIIYDNGKVYFEANIVLSNVSPDINKFLYSLYYDDWLSFKHLGGEVNSLYEVNFSDLPEWVKVEHLLHVI